MLSTPTINSFFKSRTLIFITGALGFVAALGWNDAFQTLFHHIFLPIENIQITTPTIPPLLIQSNWRIIIAKFIYALIVSIIVIIVFYILIHWSNPDILR